MAEEIVRYKDRDGAEITLTPNDVAQFCATGGGQISQRDVVNFMATCKALGANPFTRDVYLVKYNGSEAAQIIAGKNYYTRVAAQMESFDGMRAGVVVVGSDGSLSNREGSITLPGEQLVGGWAEVHDKRWSVPIRSEVAFSEYNTGKSLWRSKPSTMIRKVALVQALREAYPDRFAGTYDSAEMPDPPQAGPQEVESTVSGAQAGPEPADNVWIGQQASRLQELGYDAGQAANYIVAQWRQGGRPAAEQAVAQMTAQAQQPQQQPAQEVEATYEDVAI